MARALYEQLSAVVNQLPELCTPPLVFPAILPKQALPSQTGEWGEWLWALQGLSSISRPGWVGSTSFALSVGKSQNLLRLTAEMAGFGMTFCFFIWLLDDLCMCEPTISKDRWLQCSHRSGPGFQNYRTTNSPHQKFKSVLAAVAKRVWILQGKEYSLNTSYAGIFPSTRLWLYCKIITINMGLLVVTFRVDPPFSHNATIWWAKQPPFPTSNVCKCSQVVRANNSSIFLWKSRFPWIKVDTCDTRR